MITKSTQKDLESFHGGDIAGLALIEKLDYLDRLWRDRYMAEPFLPTGPTAFTNSMPTMATGRTISGR
ncbi:hypothetical protein MASR1M12_38720 [Erysipelotrichia bacterium]